MNHFWLLAAVSASYLGTVLVYRRLRVVWGRTQGFPPELLRPLDLDLAFAPLLKQAPRLTPFVEQLEAGDLAGARAAWPALSGDLPGPSKSLVEAVLALQQAEREPGRLARYLLAAKARRLARAAGGAPEAVYLWLSATLGYLTDSVNLELVLWQSGRLLRRALAQHGQAPLLHLGAALRAAAAGETAEALQALARALYHSQGNHFIAALVLGLPRINELAPSLAAEAWKLEEGPPSEAGAEAGSEPGGGADG